MSIFWPDPPVDRRPPPLPDGQQTDLWRIQYENANNLYTHDKDAYITGIAIRLAVAAAVVGGVVVFWPKRRRSVAGRRSRR